MRKVNAIDLDGTLLPFDSMQYFYKIWLKNIPTSLPLIKLTVQRKTGLINRSKFLEFFLKIIEQEKDVRIRSEKFGKSLIPAFSNTILKNITDNSDIDTINVLCTSSPRCYTELLANHLGWDLICSDYINGNFVHNYGSNKVKLFTENFPKAQYAYNYAVADSESDVALLKIFSKSLLIPTKFHRT